MFGLANVFAQRVGRGSAAAPALFLKRGHRPKLTPSVVFVSLNLVECSREGTYRTDRDDRANKAGGKLDSHDPPQFARLIVGHVPSLS